MEIGVIGGGSVGLLMGIYLSDKHHVTIYVKRESQKKKINKEGLYLTGSQKRYSVKALLLNEMNNEDLIIVCVKQPQLINVLRFLQSQKELMPLLFLQNGMSHLEHLKELLNPILLGIVEHGAFREKDNHLSHTGKGIVSIASYNTTSNELDRVIKQLNSASFPIHKSENFDQLLKEKLVVNAVINPLTAMLKIKNGSVITDSSALFLANKICEEVARTIKLDPHEQWLRVKSIAQKTSENHSSMLTDIINNQETEIESILGYILAISKEEIPYTLFVYHGIKAIEASKGEVK